MSHTFFFRTDASILCLLLFVTCLLMVRAGQWVRGKFMKPDEPESKGGVNSLLGALFGLWGFMLAFNFGNSSARFENVRGIIVDETNAIRNAILRTRVLPDSLAKDLRHDLALYLQARKAYYESGKDMDAYLKSKEDAVIIVNNMWNKVVLISGMPNMGFATSNMFASISNMLDIATKRDALLQAGVPEPIQYVLFLLAIAISFIGGFTTPVIQYKEWIVITGFMLLACTIIYITLDLSRPMRGLIQPEAAEQKLESLQKLLSQ